MKRLDAIKSLVAEDLDWPLCHEDCAWLLARVEELATALKATPLDLDDETLFLVTDALAKLDEEVK